MRSQPQPTCPNCGSQGAIAYTDLTDHLFGAPGSWNLKHCLSAQCGAYWPDPVPHPEDLPQAYKGYYTHNTVESSPTPSFLNAIRTTFSRQKLGYPMQRDWRMELVSRLLYLSPTRLELALYSHFYLPWKGGGRVLEIGCGSGRQLEVLKQAGWDASGVDFDPEAAAAARQRGLHVEVGDLRNLHYPEASFDAIVMAHLIEHVYDPVGLLTECRRLLKPGGQLICITPNAVSLGHRIYRQAWRGLEPPRHLVVFTPQGLCLGAERAGLKVDHVRVSARDAANMLLASTRIADATNNEQIEHPQSTMAPPLRLRILGLAEQIAMLVGLQWGEELVLFAYK